jgi:hypothetical protein
VRLEFPADLGLAVPVVMSLLSLRLFRLAARSRALPEVLVGVYFMIVPVGISLSIRVDRFAPEHAAAVRAVAAALFTSGGIALLLFAWSVFRPAENWARGLAWGGSLVLGMIWAGALAAGAYRSEVSLFLLLPTYASYFWVFVESIRYYGLLRRRRSLGLADPVVANRFLLFAIWTGAVFTITVLGVVGSFAQLVNGTFHDGGGLGDPIILGITRVLAVPIAASIWLTFLAPERYHAWLRRRSPLHIG